jgi:hypothetical protein
MQPGAGLDSFWMAEVDPATLHDTPALLAGVYFSKTPCLRTGSAAPQPVRYAAVKEVRPPLPSESARVTFESGFNVLQHSHHRGASHVLIRFAVQIVGDAFGYRFG